MKTTSSRYWAGVDGQIKLYALVYRYIGRIVL